MKINNLSNIIVENTINEGLNSAEIAQYPSFVGDVIRQAYSKSVLPIISSVLPLKAPVGKVYSLISYYSGNTEQNANFSNTKILQVDDSSPFTENGDISSSSGGQGTVLHIESAYILVKILNGTFNISDNLDNSSTYSSKKATILNTYSSMVSRKKIFRNYSNKDVDEYSTNVKNIQHKTIDKVVVAESKKLKSKITLEAYQDLTATYGIKANDLLTDVMSSEITLEIDQEAFALMRSWAKQGGDLVLNQGYAASGGGGLEDVLKDIGIRINKELALISRSVGQNIDGFAVCSPRVVNALISTGVVSHAYSGTAEEQERSISNNYIGKMFGIIDIIQDDYADEDYVLVGYKGIGIGNAGLIYSPYTTNLTVANDPENGNPTFYYLNRYAFSRNPFDEGINIGDSDYFYIFNVDFSNLKNY
jgi:hypothetical protein